jgi:hypothetical protein
MTDQEHAYHVSDLPKGQQPDPLGDKNLTAAERVGADTRTQQQQTEPPPVEQQTEQSDENA